MTVKPVGSKLSVVVYDVFVGVPLVERLESPLTVTKSVAEIDVSTVDVAVIVAVPAFTPVTTPVVDTVATALLLVDQVTEVDAPLVVVDTLNWLVPPTEIVLVPEIVKFSGAVVVVPPVPISTPPHK